MSVVFTRKGFERLRTSWILLLLSVGVAAAIGVGSQWYKEREQRENTASGRKLQEARARLESARRERDNQIESAEVFRTLVDRGMLQAERRIDMVELVSDLKARNKIASIDYEIAPQRALPLPGGRAFASVDVLGSRVKLKIAALHEGDLFSFLDAFSRATGGFYPMDRCTFRRSLDSGPGANRPRVEAECGLEWITLKEKSRAS